MHVEEDTDAVFKAFSNKLLDGSPSIDIYLGRLHGERSISTEVWPEGEVTDW